MRRVEPISPENVRIVEHGQFAEDLAAASAREAVDLLAARLRQRLVRSARNWPAIRCRVRKC